MARALTALLLCTVCWVFNDRVDCTQYTPSQTPKATPTPPPDEVGPGDVIRITTNLITIPVRVRDQKGRYVHDMRQEEFRIFEEGVEQQLAYFAPVESPFTVLLMLDVSDSTEASLKDIKEAAFTFISQLRPDDAVIIAVFDSRLNVLAQPTSDRNELRALLDGSFWREAHGRKITCRRRDI